MLFIFVIKSIDLLYQESAKIVKSLAGGSLETVLTKLSTVSSNSNEGLSATELALVKGVGALVNHSNKRRDTGDSGQTLDDRLHTSNHELSLDDERSVDYGHLSDSTNDNFGRTKAIPNTSRLSILTI